MKKTIILITLTIALISIACQSAAVLEKTKAVELKTDLPQDQNPSVVEHKPDLTQIQNSTLLIVVEDIKPSGVTLAYDMGTVVQYQGQSYLVTHNHWGDALKDMNIIEIRDAQFKMLGTIFARDFKSLVAYQDAGTMVLHLPAGLPNTLTPGNLDSSPLKPGDTVQVAHWSYPNRDCLEVSDAVVKEINTFKGEPVYTLRSLDGQTLHPGDSGGGVWHNGKLVANTWTVLTIVSTAVNSTGTVDASSETLTDLSHAAIFPVEFK